MRPAKQLNECLNLMTTLQSRKSDHSLTRDCFISKVRTSESDRNIYYYILLFLGKDTLFVKTKYIGSLS